MRCHSCTNMLFCCNIFCAQQPLQFFEEERVPGGVQPARRGQLLLGILQIQDHRDITIKDLQQIHHFIVLRAAAGRQTDKHPSGSCFDRVRAAFIQAGRVVAVRSTEVMIT